MLHGARHGSQKAEIRSTCLDNDMVHVQSMPLSGPSLASLPRLCGGTFLSASCSLDLTFVWSFFLAAALDAAFDAAAFDAFFLPRT